MLSNATGCVSWADEGSDPERDRHRTLHTVCDPAGLMRPGCLFNVGLGEGASPWDLHMKGDDSRQVEAEIFPCPFMFEHLSPYET